ncbi:hypothetical protein CR513_38509, partial [Mucuna pruriens]
MKDIREKKCVRGDIEENRIVEQLITNFGVQGRKGVNLVVVALEDYALVWWTFLMDDIRKGIEEPCESWYNLKGMVRKRYVPSSYERDIHHKLQSLYQGSRSVEEFHKEMEMTLLRAQIREREEATIARFLHGLNREIQDIVELLRTLVHQEIKVEMQLKRSAFKRSTTSSSSLRGRDKEKVRSDKSPKKGSDPFYVRKEITITPTHRTSNNGEIESDISHGDTSTSSDSESHSDDSQVEGDLLMVRRLMGSQVLEEAKTQRENIFHSRCHVLGNLCSVIINGSSCVNVASERFVMVDRQVEVSLTIGKYEDKVLCDVVPMKATHLLLGRPWQYDRKVIHDGVTNKFTFVHMDESLYLQKLLRKVRKKMREKRKKDREVILREIEKVREKQVRKIKEPIESGKSKKEEKSEGPLLVGPKEVKKVLLTKREPLYALSTNMLYMLVLLQFLYLQV